MKNAFRNSFFVIVSQVILIVFGFFSQRVMNLRMGEELVGMNSVIANILALMSVTELGVSTAVVFHLYEALDSKDEKKIAALINLYRKAYYVFAAVIAALGLCILPFVHIFLKKNSFTLPYIRTVFLLWLIRTVVSYLFSYKRSIIIADQKEYVITIGLLLANATNYMIIIVILEVYRDFVLALSLNILVECILNLWISGYVNKKYTYLKTYRKHPLDKGIIQKIVDDIKNIFITKLSLKLLVSTDNLIISSFISVGIMGLYSNYCMITQSLINIVTALSATIQPTIGNMFIEKNHDKNFNVLRQLTFVFYVIASFSTVSLITLMTPFVADVWLNPSYTLDSSIIVCSATSFFVQTLGLPLMMMLGVTGLFKKERNLCVAVALVNLVVSLALVQYIGVAGVIIGTILSYTIQMIICIKLLVKGYMQKSIGVFVGDVLQYVALTIGELLLVTLYKLHFYDSQSIISFALLMAVCVVVPNGVNLLVYHRSWRFQSVWRMIKNMVQKQDVTEGKE